MLSALVDEVSDTAQAAMATALNNNLRDRETAIARLTSLATTLPAQAQAGIARAIAAISGNPTGVVNSALVTAAVADLGLEIPVRGGFCFVDTELPLLGTPTINGLSIFGRRGRAKRLQHGRARADCRGSDRRAVPGGVAIPTGGRVLLSARASERLRLHNVLIEH